MLDNSDDEDAGSSKVKSNPLGMPVRPSNPLASGGPPSRPSAPANRGTTGAKKNLFSDSD